MEREEYKTLEVALDRIEELEEKLEDAETEAEELRDKYEVVQARLLEMADFLADRGLIVNTPHAKLRWIEEGVRLHA